MLEEVWFLNSIKRSWKDSKLDGFNAFCIRFNSFLLLALLDLICLKIALSTKCRINFVNFIVYLKKTLYFCQIVDG